MTEQTEMLDLLKKAVLQSSCGISKPDDRRCIGCIFYCPNEVHICRWSFYRAKQIIEEEGRRGRGRQLVEWIEKHSGRGLPKKDLSF